MNTQTQHREPEPKFRKFWVKSVNNYICDAGYNGKELKAKSPTPSFRKYYFIKSWEDLKGFTTRKEISNIDLVKSLLAAHEREKAIPTVQEEDDLKDLDNGYLNGTL